METTRLKQSIYWGYIGKRKWKLLDYNRVYIGVHGASMRAKVKC